MLLRTYRLSIDALGKKLPKTVKTRYNRSCNYFHNPSEKKTIQKMGKLNIYLFLQLFFHNWSKNKKYIANLLYLSSTLKEVVLWFICCFGLVKKRLIFLDGKTTFAKRSLSIYCEKGKRRNIKGRVFPIFRLSRVSG